MSNLIKDNSIKIKIKNKFTSPLTGKRTEIGGEFNVPKNQFWIKRINQKDCEEIKKFSAKPKAENKSDSKKPKGSK